MATLFDDVDGGELGDFQVNKKWAEAYHDRKRRQELAQAREAGLLDERGEVVQDEESSSDDDDDVAISKAESLKVMHVLNLIKKKDPSIYQKDAHFFKAPEEDSGDKAGSETPSQRRKKTTAADIVRSQVLEAAATGRSDAFDDKQSAVHMGDKMYDAEQAALRDAVLSAGAGAEVQGGEDDDDDFLVKRPVQAGAGSSDDEDGEGGVDPEVVASARAWAGGVSSAPPPISDDDVLNPAAASSGALSDKAQDYLKWFTATRAWEAEGGEEDEDAELEEDADELDAADAFEAAYNFRFEEPGGADIATYPRSQDGGLRRKESKRKRQREAKARRKEEEKAEREAETRRLINLKREEETKAVAKLLDMAGDGLDKEAAASILASVAGGDWDEGAFDAAMAGAFGQEYYMAAEEDDVGPDGKPTIPAWMLQEGGEGGPDPDAAGGAAPPASGEEEDGGSDGEASQPAPDTDAQAQEAERLALLSAASRAVVQAAVANKEAELGYEDVIAGGTLKTKFKYRSVPQNAYGLDTETLLAAPDATLNQFVPLKKLAPYRDSEYRLSGKRAAMAASRVRASIAEAEAAAAAAAAARKKEARKARKEKKASKKASGEGADKPKKEKVGGRKRRRKEAKEAASEGADASGASAAPGLSKSRLASYGAAAAAAVTAASKKKRRRKRSSAGDA